MKWKVLSSRKVYQHERIVVNEDVIDRGKGKEKHPRIEFCDCTRILALDDENNVFLIKEYRHAVKQEILNTPGGKIEENETPVEAAKRELEEETGIKAKKWVFQGIVHPTSAKVKNTHYLFLAQELEFSKPKEHLEVLKIPFKELLEKISSGEVTDAATIIQAFKVKEMVKK